MSTALKKGSHFFVRIIQVEYGQWLQNCNVKTPRVLLFHTADYL